MARRREERLKCHHHFGSLLSSFDSWKQLFNFGCMIFENALFNTVVSDNEIHILIYAAIHIYWTPFQKRV